MKNGTATAKPNKAIWTSIASCSRKQHKKYGCIEWALQQGMLDRHIYVMGIEPLAPTGYGLVVTSPVPILSELPTLFPGVEDWHEHAPEEMAQSKHDGKPPLDITLTF